MARAGLILIFGMQSDGCHQCDWCILADMLPASLVQEIFNMHHSLSDIACQQIADELEEYSLAVNNIQNYDHAVVFTFGTIALPPGPFVTVEGELRVDRIGKSFEIIAKCGQYLIFPTKGQWEDVVQFLEQLVSIEGYPVRQSRLMPAQLRP